MSAKKSTSPSGKFENGTVLEMILLKTVLKICTLAALFVSANVFSADFLVDTTINDSMGDAHGGDKYEVSKMDVQWAVNDVITVDIYTNFVGHNNSSSAGNRGIVLGDLLISTQGDNTPYDYAFVLSDKDRKKNYSRDYDHGVWDKHWDKQGTFTEIDSTRTSKDYHNNSNAVLDGQVMADGTVGTGQKSAWSIDNFGRYSGQMDKISFSFNVNGIDAFQNASQLAFSWAMSCANDVVDGVVSVNRPSTNVPEPASLLLMLLALAFMAKSRSKKSNGFSA